VHPAASPFVAGKYARKAIIAQYQFFCWQTKLSAFFILCELGRGRGRYSDPGV
jgi:hypothetical protein